MHHLCAIVLALAVGPAHAEPPAAPLAGPKVAAADRPTIIERGFDGLVKLAEPTPEQAALGLLTLSDSEKSATGAVLSKRAAILDDFLTNNIPLLTQFGNANGDTKEQLALAYAAMIKLKPLTDLGPLQNQLHAALGPENAAKFDAIMKDYWAAYIKDRANVRKPDGKYPNKIEIMAEAKLQSLGKAIENSFKQMMEGGDLIYQYLFKGITLRPDQSDKLHDLVNNFARTTKGAATNEQNGQLFFSILPILDETQRPLFTANIRELGGKQKKK